MSFSGASNCGLVSTSGFKTRAYSFGVDSGRSLGIVNNLSANTTCDWGGGDSQQFYSIYYGPNAPYGGLYDSSHNYVRPNVFSVWMRGLTISPTPSNSPTASPTPSPTTGTLAGSGPCQFSTWGGSSIYCDATTDGKLLTAPLHPRENHMGVGEIVIVIVVIIIIQRYTLH